MFLHNTLCKLVCPLGIEGNTIFVVAAEENALASVVLKPSKAALEREKTLGPAIRAYLRIFTLHVTWVCNTAVVSFANPGR